jgi:hypothetical protein
MKPQHVKQLFGKVAGSVLGLLLFLSLGAYGQVGDTTAQAVKGEIEQAFTLPAGERQTIEFELAHTGLIQVVADWVPKGTELSLILFRPAQMNFIARADGCSPCELKYNVSEHDTERGTTWKLRIVNMSGENVNGFVSLHYPVHSEGPVQ